MPLASRALRNMGRGRARAIGVAAIVDLALVMFLILTQINSEIPTIGGHGRPLNINTYTPMCRWMRVESSLLREPGEHPLPREMRAIAPRARGRPRSEYRPRVRSPEDVARLRRHRVPAFLLTSEWVTESGYPVSFRPWLAVPANLAGKIVSDYRLLPVHDEESLRAPGPVELVTLLLRFDPLAARVVAQRNRHRLDPNELYRRVRNEGLERPATKVRLQEFAPALPKVGESLPREELRWIERNNPPLPAAQ